jgi:excisionase family DNA binding protein
MNHKLLTVDQVAELLGTSRSNVRRCWYAGTLPAPIRLGRRGIRWRADELAEFISAKQPAPKPNEVTK